jgi:hypothetical protein
MKRELGPYKVIILKLDLVLDLMLFLHFVCQYKMSGILRDSAFIYSDLCVPGYVYCMRLFCAFG